MQTRSPEDLAAAARRAFSEIHRTVFLGDPAANPVLSVAVFDPATVIDTPTFVLLTPWTLNGLFFPPDKPPEVLVVADRPRRVFAQDVDFLGAYLSVNLVPDVSRLTSRAQAEKLARSWVAPFRAAVAEIRARPAVGDGPR